MSFRDDERDRRPAGDRPAVTVPEDLAAALAGDEAARATFESLPYSHKRQHVLAIEDARTPATRARRIDKALAMLREGRR